MSKISLKPNSAGTANFEIAAPATNTDRTFTLPDEAGTVVTTATDLEPQVKDSLNATGSAPIYACRAWVNCNTKTTSIRESANVSSITDIGVGFTRINFSTSMPDANYSVSATASDEDNNTKRVAQIDDTGISSSFIQINTYNVHTNGAGDVETEYLTVAVLR